MCGEVPLVTSSMDHLSYRNALHFMCVFTLNICTMKCQPSSIWHRYEHDVIYTTSMTENSSFPSNHQLVSASTILQLTDQWRRCTWLATAVTEPQPIQLTCVGLHEAYGVFKRGEHGTKTTLNSQHCKILEQYHSALQGCKSDRQQIHSLYQSQFAGECNLVLPEKKFPLPSGFLKVIQ
jgi:hypothetical protein